jgi:tetrapyrrole methylase family protein / MazG family protein
VPDARPPVHPVTVIGLGPGDPAHLTAAARAAIEGAPAVWLRTDRLPGRDLIPPHVSVRTCDDLYEAGASFDAVYRAIAARLVAAAADGPVVYAVPGDPATGETAVVHLRAACAPLGIPVVVLPGVSFLGPTLSALGWDALDGLQIADATALAQRHHPDLDPDRPALVAQVYNRLVASDVKIVLMGAYPPEHPVTLVSGAGTSGQRIAVTTLAALDHRDDFDDLTTLAVLPLDPPGSVLALAEVVAALRAPDGCPWDREQTHASLRPFLLEECYEVLAALDADDDAALADELGDLLLQIVLHAQLASEDGAFTLTDVARHITAKIIRRHPHVFGEGHADTPDAVRGLWEQLKADERAGRGEVDDPVAGVPLALPALARAQTMQRKAAAAGLSLADPSPGSDAHADTDALPLFLRGVPPPDGADRAARIAATLWAVATVAETWGVDAEAAMREKLSAIRFQ